MLNICLRKIYVFVRIQVLRLIVTIAATIVTLRRALSSPYHQYWQVSYFPNFISTNNREKREIIV